MPFKKGESGNPGGRTHDKIWAEAIRIAVHRAAKDGKTKRLHQLADKLVANGLEGDTAALREIGDRLDGKPSQSTEIKGDANNPVTVLLKNIYVRPGQSD